MYKLNYIQINVNKKTYNSYYLSSFILFFLAFSSIPVYFYIMTTIPMYPEFIDIQCSLFDEIHPFLQQTGEGISEFTFPSLFLHRTKYGYKLTRLSQNCYALSGTYKEKRFFSLLGLMAAEDEDKVIQLLDQFDYWKNMSEAQKEKLSPGFLQKIEQSYDIIDDRDNADYLYYREDLALLPGKSFHKKKNLVNAFEAAYTPEVKPLDGHTKEDARKVLDEWHADRDPSIPTDYIQCVEALNSMDLENKKICMVFSGVVVYADGKPVGWALGETINKGNSFCVHFEKGINSYKGVYQYLNRATALSLPPQITYINREQDLGDEGLRQAKMTYRPCGFVKKYRISPKS